MANATVSRLGLVEATGTGFDALFLKVFSGEVMASFNANTVMKDRVRTRNISSGKSAQFPAIGKTVAAYHTPGAEINGTAIKHNEKIITIDDLLISSAFIANIDEAKNHYDVRSEYSTQLGQALAQTYDRNLLSMAIKDCATPPTAIADQGTSEQIVQAGVLNMATAANVSTFVGQIYTAAQKLDEKNVPKEDRFVFVSPAAYYGMVQNDKIVNRDFGGTNGVYSDGTVINVAGMQVIMTNNLAVNHTSGGTVDTAANKYGVNASAYLAIVMQKGALGSVELLSMASESEYDIRRQGTLMVSKMATGHGTLRPECMVAIKNATS